MNVLICIDDTDQLNTPGTGHLVEDFCHELAERGWANCSAISRHQLFVHEDIPYTSHNSAMCFQADLQPDMVNDVIDFGGIFLKEKSAPGSDPGLCVAVLNDHLNREKLIDFGQRAKHSVLTKKDAYVLARELGIHLSEHGGTGQGVVGALSGVGLRLYGNDGRFRGWYHLGRIGTCRMVGTLKGYDFIDAVKGDSGETLSDDEYIYFGADEQKTVQQDSKQVLLVKRSSNESGRVQWTTLTKQQIKIY